MKIVNALVYNEKFIFERGEITVDGQKFADVGGESRNGASEGCVARNGMADGGGESGGSVSVSCGEACGDVGVRGKPVGGDVCYRTAADGELEIDAGGCYVIPGLIDIHLHGCAGYNFYDASHEELVKMLQYQAANGVTAICPSTLTLPEDALIKACSTISETARRIFDAAEAAGSLGAAW